MIKFDFPPSYLAAMVPLLPPQEIGIGLRHTCVHAIGIINPMRKKECMKQMIIQRVRELSSW
jgi:hypothetical protein